MKNNAIANFFATHLFSLARFATILKIHYICEKELKIMRRPHLVNEISRVMRENFPQVVTYLYGSEARGEARENSDIDLLILAPDNLNDSQFRLLKNEIFDKIFDVEVDYFADISPLILQHKTWMARKTPFTVNVTNDRVRL
jgi:predicted nucleotidyltransferase